jgi:hypothetical protein
MSIRLPIAVLFFAAISVSVSQAQTRPDAPGSLQAISATRSEVALAWEAIGAGATGYIVESLGADRQWTRLGPTRTVTSATFPAEPFATYTLRVRAMGASESLSDPSKEITVGPPPTGYHSGYSDA